MQFYPQCFACKHYNGDYKCDAFEGDIPGPIYFNEFDHSEPHPDDNGLRFEHEYLDKESYFGEEGTL